MPYLFQVSIGPVQSFIKEARRTRDLKFGSWFLNEISWVAARTIANRCGGQNLLFPAPSLKANGELEESGDAPNKILAYIDTSPEELAQTVKDAIDERVNKLKNNAWQNIRTKITIDVAEEQIKDLVEYVSVSLQFDKQKDPYDKTRLALDSLLAARKNTRDFLQVEREDNPSIDALPKSSLDGKLECVIPKGAYPRLHGIERKSDREKREIYQQIETFRVTFGAGLHEMLSGVDLLKRLGPIEDGEKNFPSTSHMAALPFLSGLNILSRNPQLKIEERLKKYKEELLAIRQIIPSFALDILPKGYQHSTFGNSVLTLGEYDGALLYPERFPDVVGDSQMFKDARKQFLDATNFLENFCKSINLHPSPYYVLLAADGDSMGATINWQAQTGMEQHQAFSRALANFSGGVAGIVTKHAGVCIYAGGDDVLALLPLHKAVQCASELAQRFKTSLSVFTNEHGRSPTLSVGLAVVHHLHPLGDALEIARRAETQAKKNPGKNALAITVQKRGGPPCTVDGHWDVFDQRLEHQIRLYQSTIIPTGMAYELEEIALRLEPEPDHGADQPISAPHVQYAALRVFQRKLDEAKREGHSADKIASTLDMLKEMIGLEHTQPVRVGRLADELTVARLFADARRLADGKIGGETV